MSRDRWSDHPCEALSALVDGELPDGERSAVEAHLGTCPVCRGLREDFDRLGRAVADEAAPPVPRDLATRIRARLRDGAPAPRTGWWRSVWAAPMPLAAAATVVVAALVWLAWPGGRPPGAPVPGSEVKSGVGPAASVAAAAPAATAPDAAAPAPPAPALTAAPQATAPARAPGPQPVRAPAARPAPLGSAREKVEPKPARPTSAPDSVVAGRDDARRNEATAEGMEKDAAAEGALIETGFLEGAAKQDASAKSAVRAPMAPAAEAPATPAPMGPRAATLAMPPMPMTFPPLEAAPYIVRLLQSGSMSVRTRDYQCAVPITAEDARLLATMGDTAMAKVATRGPAAGSAGTGAATSDTASSETSGAAPGAAVGAAAGEAAPAAMAEPNPVVLTPEARAAVVRLVRERYRAVIEARCGPLPR